MLRQETRSRGVARVLAITSILLPGLTVLDGVPARASSLPVPVNCQVDPSGANDRPGQRDTTKFCVEEGDGLPYELHTLVNMDEIAVPGANTIDGCALFNTDGDAFVDLAVCVTMTGSGTSSGNLATFGNLRLFSCSDKKADRCSNPVLLPKPYTTTCEVSQTDDDPFGPSYTNGPGDDYPWDTRVLCAIDLDDFGVHGTITRMADGCSYPSSVPNSDADDCVLFQPCVTSDACDDENPCSVDSCDPAGVCIHVPGPAVACSDGLFCDGDESCNSLGFCEASGVARDCDDRIDCTIDSCDEMADACVNDPRASVCDDGLYCDGVEACDTTAGCLSGAAPDCSDGVDCSADSCDEDADTCRHLAVDTACDDGLFCNGPETCDAGSGCIHGAAPACGDDVECTADSCDESTRACAHSPIDAACDDGRTCNGAETCDPSGGCVVGTEPSCDDGVDCTIDRCDATLNACVNEPDNFFCSDGSLCNGIEVCDAQGGCRANRAPCSGTARCGNSCSGCTADSDCNNGLACDGPESCDIATGTCLPGVPLECGDAVACTLDLCDEAAGGCVHTPVDAACDDGRFCNGAETCDATAGCAAGTRAACDDGVACTVDSCVESTATCSHAPDDALCDNGLFCDGVEYCDDTLGCQAGEDVRCRPDGSNCSVERCNEKTDSCTSDFSNCVCGDRELTAPEECEPPQRAGTFEDCNNLVDDDRDGLVDCSDPDCSIESRRSWLCDENCRRDLACAPVKNDPALIMFRQGRGPDSLWVHGRFEVSGEIDPATETFTLRLSNGVQPVFVATLEAGLLKDEGGYYQFTDPDARTLGSASRHGGLAAVRLRRRTMDGVPNVTFRIQAYGDFRAASLRVMRTEVAVGPESGTLTAEWQAKPKKWLLHQKEF